MLKFTCIKYCVINMNLCDATFSEVCQLVWERGGLYREVGMKINMSPLKSSKKEKYKKYKTNLKRKKFISVLKVAL